MRWRKENKRVYQNKIKRKRLVNSEHCRLRVKSGPFATRKRVTYEQKVAELRPVNDPLFESTGTQTVTKR